MWVSIVVSFTLFSTLVAASVSPTATLRTVIIRRDEAPPISTISTPTNGHQTGDIVITVPDADNTILSQILSQNVCPNSKRHKQKRLKPDCFFKGGEAIYGSMHGGGMRGLVDMANGGLLLPLPPDDLNGGLMDELEMMGEGVPNLDQQARGRLANIVWWVQYPTLVMETRVEDPVKVIPAAVATRVVPAPPAQTSKRCHLPDRVPYCTNCGGDNTESPRITCVGFGDLWKGCPCYKKTQLPRPQQFAPAIPPEMADAWQALLGKKTEVACLGEKAAQDIGLWSKLVDNFCKDIDMSKVVLKSGMTIADIHGTEDYSKYKHYKYVFNWEPKTFPTTGICRPSCKAIFSSMKECGNGSKSEMAKAGSAKTNCGVALYKLEDRTWPEPRITCKKHRLGAPRGDKEASGATSLDKAIDEYCTKNDGKDIKAGYSIYQRWGMTELGVPNRSSFWLRSTVPCTGVDSLPIVKNECIEALTKGTEHCDPGSGYSHGLTATVGCMDYSINLSGGTRDSEPPWAEAHGFPPPEDTPGPNVVPVCTESKYWGGRTISEFDLERAIDAFCVNGKEIHGFGKSWEHMFRFPPKSQPQFYDDTSITSHISLGAETINNGAPNPYYEMDWCDGFDWKTGREDCQFALRKMFKTCNVHPGKFVPAEYMYRCVNYKVVQTNLRKGEW